LFQTCIRKRNRFAPLSSRSRFFRQPLSVVLIMESARGVHERESKWRLVLRNERRLFRRQPFASHRAKLVVTYIINTRKLPCAEMVSLCSNEEVVWKRGNMGTRPISAGSSAHDQCTLKNIKSKNQIKMADVDQWIEIAKQCKYLPENDLKVTFIDWNIFLVAWFVN